MRGPALVEEAAADEDVVGALAERDRHRGDGRVGAGLAAVVTRGRSRRCSASQRSSACDDVVHDPVVRRLVRIDGQVGEGIDRVADLHELAHGSFRIGGSAAAGRLCRLRTRRMSTSRSAFSQTEMPCLGDPARGSPRS